jgi:hypothetical protein
MLALPPELALELGPALVSERLPAGDLDVGPMPVPLARLAGRVGLWPGWELGARLQYMEYTLVDAQAPASRHHRDDFQFGGELAYRLPIGPSVALGYTGRFVGVVNSVAAPIAQPLLFSPAQLYHGPRVGLGWEGPWRPGFQLDLAFGFRPYLFAAGDPAVASLAPLWGYDARAGVSWPLGGGAGLRFGLALDAVGGYYHDFRHTDLTPSLAGTWGF